MLLSKKDLQDYVKLQKEYKEYKNIEDKVKSYIKEGDYVYYNEYDLSKFVDFDHTPIARKYTISNIYFDENSKDTEIFITSVRREGLVSINELYKTRKEAVKAYNSKVKSFLVILVTAFIKDKFTFKNFILDNKFFTFIVDSELRKKLDKFSAEELSKVPKNLLVDTQARQYLINYIFDILYEGDNELKSMEELEKQFLIPEEADQ